MLKRDKQCDALDNYRAIGSECALLKLLILLIDGQVRLWAEDRKILPLTQWLQTWVPRELRCFHPPLHDQELKAEGMTPYVASVESAKHIPVSQQPAAVVAQTGAYRYRRPKVRPVRACV